MLEVRSFSAEVRADQKSMRVSGYAATYGTRSNPIKAGNGSFRERIRAGAFDSVLKRNTDVVATFNHSHDAVLGRVSAGTLRLSSDSKGLAFDCDLPDTTLGRDMYTSVRRGDIKDCSFAFRGVVDDWDEEDDDEDDDKRGSKKLCAVRNIRSIAELDDISLVTRPAYPGTQVQARKEIVAAETRSAFDAFLRTKFSDADDLKRGEQICEQWNADAVYQQRMSILNQLL